jgi:hypothetical protein
MCMYTCGRNLKATQAIQLHVCKHIVSYCIYHTQKCKHPMYCGNTPMNIFVHTGSDESNTHLHTHKHVCWRGSVNQHLTELCTHFNIDTYSALDMCKTNLQARTRLLNDTLHAHTAHSGSRITITPPSCTCMHVCICTIQTSMLMIYIRTHANQTISLMARLHMT